MADINGIINTDENIDTKVNTDVVDEPIKVDVPEKKYLQMTQEDLDEIITKRLERASKKSELEKAEAEKLASMSEGERLKALFDKEKESFAEERKQYQKEKLELQVVKELGTKNLPTVFSKYLIGEDAETCMNNIKEFEASWAQALANAIDGKIKGTTPKIGGGTATQMTKEQFNKMGYKEMVQFKLENEALYSELMK